MRRLLTLFALLLAFAAPGAASQDAGDIRLMDAYGLTESKVQALAAASADMRLLEASSKPPPADAEEAEPTDEEDVDTSIPEFAARIDAQPKAKAILVKHGLGSIDYATGFWVLTRLYLTDEVARLANKTLEQAGKETGVPEAQVRFFASHRPLMERLSFTTKK